MVEPSGISGLIWSAIAVGGPLPLFVAGALLTAAAWVLLARSPPAATPEGTVRERLWVRAVVGAITGEVVAYVAAALVLWLVEGDPLGFLACGFLEYVVTLLLSTPVGPAWGLAAFLLATESFGFVVVFLYQFYTLEFLAGDPFRAPRGPPPLEGPEPMVAVQVACYDEPPELVRECLASVRRLDYPRDRLVVQLLDDSNAPAARRALEAVCRELGIEYRHRTHRRGFKAGALNDGAAALPAGVEFLAIVDADYRVHPGFLRQTLGGFADPRVAWVQTPQAYWNANTSRFTRLYCLADAFFYRVVQPVRAAASSSIFCGTMGVLRRSALASVGGWDESSITEDAEVSLRLYAAGWTAVYLPTVLGEGYAPDRFPDLKSQFSRWAFGGLQMLRKDLRLLAGGRLTLRQRVDFLASGIFWTDGIFLLAMAGALSTMVLGSLGGLVWATPSPALLLGVTLAPVLLVADGLVKTRLALGRVTKVGLSESLGVLGFWYSLKMVNLRASMRALLRRPMGFRRTPKASAVAARAASPLGLRSTALEAGLAVLIGGLAAFGLLVAPLGTSWNGFGRTLLVAWLGYYACVFAAAPLLAWLAGARPSPDTTPAGPG
jgi:cellulose synthase/poly-beta-1,6-N-acetylglucosamine synthase-like glycosyltransferase